VTQVTSATLGPHPRLTFISVNTALPPTADSPPLSQPTHSDADFDFPQSPFALVANIPLVTMTPKNGSTEIWLGTHNFGVDVQEGAHGERTSGRIKKEPLEKQRRTREPCQPVVRKGSVVVRDLRLWHNGRPNFTEESRVMLAFIHFAPWYRNSMQVNMAEELIPLASLLKTGLQIQANFFPESKLDYLNRPYGNAYDFGQEDNVVGLF